MDVERESRRQNPCRHKKKKMDEKVKKKGGNIYLEHLPHRLPCQFQVLWNENKEPDGIRKTLGLKKKKKKDNPIHFVR